jgi:hypothetical protein
LIFSTARPAVRYDLGLTLHEDGTVSYWDCGTQVFNRSAGGDITKSGWEYMTARERKMVRAHIAAFGVEA